MGQSVKCFSSITEAQDTPAQMAAQEGKHPLTALAQILSPAALDTLQLQNVYLAP